MKGAGLTELKIIFGLAVDSAPPPRIVDLIYPDDRAAARLAVPRSSQPQRARCKSSMSVIARCYNLGMQPGELAETFPSSFNCRLQIKRRNHVQK